MEKQQQGADGNAKDRRTVCPGKMKRRAACKKKA